MPGDGDLNKAPEQLASRARRQTRLLVTAGCLEEAREGLLHVESVLAGRAAQAHR